MRQFVVFIAILIYFNGNMFAQNPAGNVLDFDGTNDYVNYANNASFNPGTGSFTIEAWIKPAALSGLKRFIWKNDGTNPPYDGYYFMTNGSKLSSGFGDGSNSTEVEGGTLSSGSWQHVAMVRDVIADKIIVYLNGTNVSELIDNTGNIIYSGNLIIGGRPGFAAEMFDGLMDEVRFWNVARTSSQINSTKNDTLGTIYYSTSDSGLVAYYRFDEGSAGGDNSAVTTLPDLSSSVLNGTLNNFALTGSTSNWVTSDAPLPVELNNFTAKVDRGKVELIWETATEVNNYGFEIERSSISSANNWEVLGFVEGHGNSNTPNSYSFIDNNTLGGLKFNYRLKQIDVDGKFEYSDILTIMLDLPMKAELMQNSPNPFNPSTAIKFFIPNISDVTIKIYDLIGREVTTLIQEQATAGFHIVFWNGRNSGGKFVSSGVYFYRLSANGKNSYFMETKKMVLLK